ncbi:MAG: urease accessory protein UreE [Acetobacteraceae bacterium]|nr:urease accessory protein UreE [Acetobacteraceae bacterium]
MRAHQVVPAGSWSLDEERGRVLLDFDRRHRRRMALQTDEGEDVLVDLAEAVHLRDGDGLLLEGGGVVRVLAQDEPLLQITADDSEELVRVAWHLGNRHLPVQLGAGQILIRADHVIADMVRKLGGHVREIEAPFDPEPGAYAGGHAHDDQ